MSQISQDDFHCWNKINTIHATLDNCEYFPPYFTGIAFSICQMFEACYNWQIWSALKCEHSHDYEYCTLIFCIMANGKKSHISQNSSREKELIFNYICELNDRVLSIGEEVTVLSINLFQAHLFCYN